MIKVLMLPSWYRYKRNPSAGIFILSQATALARTGEADVTLLNWGQNQFQLRIRDPLHSLGALKGRVFSRRDTRILETGLTELCIPHLTWTSRFLKGNIERLANKVNLDFTPDIIHAHVAFPAGYLAMLLSQKLGVPYIITEHSGPFPFLEFVSSRGISPLVLEPLREAARIVAVSSFLRQEIKSKTGLDSLVIPNSLDTSLFQPGNPAPSDGKFRLFCLSGLNVEKGATDLLQALKIASQMNTDFHLNWGGQGKLQKDMPRLLEQYGLEGRVTLLGGLKPESTVSYYQGCDCFVMPSRLESFSMVVLEAMACGKPIIATNCGGPRDLLCNECGILVPKQNPLALARAISRMSQKYSDYSQEKIRQRCLENYSHEVVGERLIELYLQVLSRLP